MNSQLNTPASNKAESLALSPIMIKNAKNRALKPVATAIFALMTAGFSTQLLAQTATDNKVDPVSPPIALSAACGSAGVVFKNSDGSDLDILNSNNSRLPVAADLGLWGESKGLPVGSKILLSVSNAQAPADGRAILKIGVKAYDAVGVLITTPVKLLIETSLGRLSVDGYSTQVLSLIHI
jgi:hypothetical protein